MSPKYDWICPEIVLNKSWFVLKTSGFVLNKTGLFINGTGLVKIGLYLFLGK